MRLLFVSGTTVGGSGRSQRELASRLVQRGHTVSFLVDDGQTATLTRWSYGHLSDLAARLGDRAGGSLARRLEAIPGRRVSISLRGGPDHLATAVPENAAEALLDEFRPDVVIGNSVLRLTWRKIRAMCERRGIPTVLYIREVESLNHFAGGTSPATAVVANAESLASQIAELGVECTFIPSLIEVGTTLVESSRKVALAINPIESRGVQMVWAIAARLPDVQFAVQESWPLSPREVEAIQRKCTEVPNVEFRRVEEPGPRLYRDARVLLVPYRIANRPRVILEAQANGIPVITAAIPALLEAVGGGGLQAELDDLDGWCEALKRMWSDEELYESLRLTAQINSARPDVDPEAIATSFELLLAQAIRTGTPRDGSRGAGNTGVRSEHAGPPAIEPRA